MDYLIYITLSVPDYDQEVTYYIVVTMHRALSRVIRGQCRKFRENDCPVAAGEEVRRNNKEENTKNGFVPPKHCLEEAAVWTTGLVLAYQLSHNRRRSLIGECPSPASIPTSSGSCSILSPEAPEKAGCPFTLASKVLSQPIFTSPPASGLNVAQRKISSPAAIISSLDRTPFIHDDVQDSELPDRLSTPTTIVEDDDIVFAFPDDPPASDATKLADGDLFDRIPNNPAEYGTKFGADMLSVLGAFEFLQAEAKPSAGSSSPSPQKSQKSLDGNGKKSKASSKNKLSSKHPPAHAMELLQRGAELGSARAIYNIGVAYERMEDHQIARDYYKRAADLGHPLATYNTAVFALRDGHLTEGYALMKTASDYGVPEAEEFLKPSGNLLTLQMEQVGKV